MCARKVFLILSWLAGLAICLSPRSGWARTWISKNGKFKLEAELLEATDTEVRLRKANRDEVTIRLDKLSDKDNQFVGTWKKEHGTTATKKPSGKEDGDKGDSGNAKGGKLARLDFKILDEEFTMQAPVGAKVEPGVFPTISYGKRFRMSISPNGPEDLADFKTRFAVASDVIALKKVLVEEDDALAYKVKMKAFNAECSVYMVIVTLGDKNYTCSDVSLEEITEKQKLTPKDIELMIHCARTLKAKGAEDEPDAPVTEIKTARKDVREWKTRDGKTEIKASFVSRKKDAITVQKESGEEVTFRLAELSERDQRYLKILADPKLSAAFAPFTGSWEAPGGSAKLEADGVGWGTFTFKGENGNALISGAHILLNVDKMKRIVTTLQVPTMQPIDFELIASGDGQSFSMKATNGKWTYEFTRSDD